MQLFREHIIVRKSLSMGCITVIQFANGHSRWAAHGVDIFIENDVRVGCHDIGLLTWALR